MQEHPALRRLKRLTVSRRIQKQIVVHFNWTSVGLVGHLI